MVLASLVASLEDIVVDDMNVGGSCVAAVMMSVFFLDSEVHSSQIFNVRENNTVRRPVL